MIDLTTIIEPKIHLGDLLVSGVGIALAWGMRQIVRGVKGVIDLAERSAFIVDTHTYVLSRISGWKPSPSMYFNPNRRWDDAEFPSDDPKPKG